MWQSLKALWGHTSRHLPHVYHHVISISAFNVSFPRMRLASRPGTKAMYSPYTILSTPCVCVCVCVCVRVRVHVRVCASDRILL